MICPNCAREQKITEQNYGALYTCLSCQAVYFVNFEGQPEFGDISTQDESVTQIETEAVFQPENFAELTTIDSPIEDVEPFAVSAIENETLNSPPDSNYSSQQQVDTAIQSFGVKTLVQAATNAFADIAQEISNFGNTDAQLASINYDLVITGIDTVETKNLFQEAIEDSKFAWDAIEIMKSIRNGQVTLKKMSPAKAYLLSKRIQFLDIEKIWKQNALG